MTQKNFNSLQRVQNTLARLVCNTPYHRLPQPLLKSLHWLPVIKRVDCWVKMTYKVRLHQQPSYLLQHIGQHRPVRSLRSSNFVLFPLPKQQLQLGLSASPSQLSGIVCHPQSEKHHHNINFCADWRVTFFNASSVDHGHPAPLYRWQWIYGAVYKSSDWLIDWLIDSQRGTIYTKLLKTCNDKQQVCLTCFRQTMQIAHNTTQNAWKS